MTRHHCAQAQDRILELQTLLVQAHTAGSADAAAPTTLTTLRRSCAQWRPSEREQEGCHSRRKHQRTGQNFGVGFSSGARVFAPDFISPCGAAVCITVCGSPCRCFVSSNRRRAMSDRCGGVAWASMVAAAGGCGAPLASRRDSVSCCCCLAPGIYA